MKTFALSKVGLHPGGRVTSVLWGQVDTGTTTVDTSVTESTKLAMGWSVNKTLMGKVIYNDAGAKVGKVEDLITSPDKKLSDVIVGAGGFLGIGRHDVATPVTQIEDKAGKPACDAGQN